MPESWQNLLKSSVSPLSEGVQHLRVLRLRPGGGEDARPRRTAAVLVPILEQAEPAIILTRRAENLNSHPGQVSFPGGAAEKGDRSAVLTALREAEEEIGLDPDAVCPIGFLDRVDTVSDYRVLPVVALVRQPPPWKPDRREVEEVFTLPLERALDPSAYSQREIGREGKRHVIYSMDWQGKQIWGITAAILLNLAWRTRRVSTHSG